MSTHVTTSKPERSSPDTVRIPSELRMYLRAQAGKNTRSYSGEIVHRLEQTRQQDQREVAQKGTQQ